MLINEGDANICMRAPLRAPYVVVAGWEVGALTKFTVATIQPLVAGTEL